jgi:hypothetical protein
MKSPNRCKCDECRTVEMVLQELDYITPVKVAGREREIISAILE